MNMLRQRLKPTYRGTLLLVGTHLVGILVVRLTKKVVHSTKEERFQLMTDIWHALVLQATT
jgi:hypothetical protein